MTTASYFRAWRSGRASAVVLLASVFAHAQQPAAGQEPLNPADVGPPVAPEALPPTSAENAPAPEETSEPQGAASAPEAVAAVSTETSAVAPSESPPTAPEVDDADVDAEALAIEQELLRGDQTATEEHFIDFYGFTDFTYARDFNQTLLGHDTFAVGRVNVYLSSDLGDNFKSLLEVRYTYLPNGSTSLSGERVDTSVEDYSNAERPIRWGGIVLERAWLEYSVHPLLNLRAGHFLTPYGIWNVDHGSPVIIGVRMPYVIGDQLFPTSQTGVQVHGMYHLPQLQLGYHLTLSNGRGPVDTYEDLDGNKAIGGRLVARADSGVGSVAVGVSGYKGTYTDSTETVSIDADGEFQKGWVRGEYYKELALGADLNWEWGGLSFQVEGVLQEIVYPNDDLRPPPILGPGYAADKRRYGGYAQVGYRFGFGGIMPFTGISYYDADDNLIGVASEAWWGLNIRPTPRVVLKVQYTYGWFPKPVVVDLKYSALALQAAWSF